MMKNIHPALIFLLLMLQVPPASGSNRSELIFDHPIQMEFVINDFIQDQEGFLWIATQNGLYRYDGHEIKAYKKETHGLSENWIETIYEDKQGIIWIGVRNGGLNKYDRESGLFSIYRHSPDDPNSIRDDTPLCIFEGKGDVLWVGVSAWGAPPASPLQTVLLKISISKSVPASLLSVPSITVLPPSQTAEAMTGKFCPRLAPLSGSLASFRVT